MKCPKCNATIEDNVIYCDYCGKKISNNNPLSNKEIELKNKVYNVKNIYLKDINKYTSYLNIWALFFGGYYLIYKKQITEGIIILFLSIITLFINPLIPIIINIVLGFTFNKCYLNKLDKDIIKFNNKTLDYIQKEGNPSIPYLIISIILSVILIIPIYTYVKKLNSQIQDLKYTVPNNFYKGNYNDDNYKSYNNDKCRITIKTSNKNSIDKFINNTLPATKTEPTYEEKDFNSNKWKKISVQNELKTTDYYYLNYNNINYLITTENYNDKCDKYYEEFLYSLNFK